MCGSGTILIEAAMAALNIPAGFYRSEFGFQRWLDYDQALWNRIVDEATIKEDVDIDFYGSDISPRYLGMARANIEEANLQDFIQLKKADFKNTTPKRTPALLLFNPPYDERLDIEDPALFYGEIGDTLKNNYTNCTAYLISSDENMLKNIGLHPSKKRSLYNGALPCKFLRYELYRGTKAETFEEELKIKN
jgi:putative N6-adenine-specific DNA methylase